MSKIGDYNLKLQEQAEELGFSTTQDAIDAGYVEGYDLINNKARLIKPLDFSKALDEQEKAHEAWLKEKHEILHRLESIKEDIIDLTDNPDYVTIDELDEVIDFIEKGEI